MAQVPVVCDKQQNRAASDARSIAADGAKHSLSAVELYVDSVKADTTAETLRTYFSQFGEVLDVSLFMHPSENTACGNGLIRLRPTFDVATIDHTKHSIHGDRINAREPADGGKQQKDAGRHEDQDYTCPHCDRTFTSHIGLVGHLRIHRTETGEPVREAPTYTHRTRLHCPHCPRTFRHRMGLFGRMRIHESGLARTPDKPTTSNTSTVHTPTLVPSVRDTTTASSVADTDTVDFSCPHCQRTFTSRIAYSVTCESIAQRLANQCLEYPPIPTKLVSTAHTVLALSGIA
nr:unnamed protein product [Spirometra erinaceieuropaei]